MSCCSSCSTDVPAGSRFCPSCGSRLEPPTSAATETSAGSDTPSAASPPSADVSSHPSVDHARFLPGTMLAGRYRIIGLLGRGGMGEVYRADDLKLGQPVALKFLPVEMEKDLARLGRLLNEVKLARQVSHPNVCRVYDVGEVPSTSSGQAGHHFISMEYVDGENLASLLKQIGRLPGDKAVQIARQLCAGLAAAHEQGILHRDLKPSNVMIDGRGRARITDFGLASLATGLREHEVRAGTPAYMAPEQMAGKEVSIRSDIYSLGLVLYELFTGKGAFEAATPSELLRMQEASAPTSPSSHVSGLDPAVERAILRCLEREPRDRPSSALAVAAALPGGDPLAAALAAGETPSPEMVADAGGAGGLSPSVATLCLALFVGALGIYLFFGSRLPELAGIGGYAPLAKPPVALAEKAGEILESLGYEEAPVDRAYGFRIDTDYLDYIEENDTSADRWERLASGQPPAVFFWYRQSPRQLAPTNEGSWRVTQSDPEQEISGEVNLVLDTEGRLRSLQIVPRQVEDSSDPSLPPDWPALFAASGLDTSAFEPDEPVWNPPYYADARAAWTGSYPGDPPTQVRVEAAAYRGKPVFFQFVEPWTQAVRDEEYELGRTLRILIAFQVGLLLMVGLGAVWLARRNLKLGRGDRGGAYKLAVFVFAASMAQWVVAGTHVTQFLTELGLLLTNLGDSVLAGGMTWLIYIALEPFVRRRWPEAMVSWNRLLAGRVRDPRVGRDVLVGAAAFGVLLLPAVPQFVLARWMGVPPPNLRWIAGGLDVLLGGRQLTSALVGSVLQALLVPIGILFLLLLLRILLRREWLAIVAIVVLFTVPTVAISDRRFLLISLVVTLLNWAVILLVLSRFGLVSVCTIFLLSAVMSLISSTDLSAWHAGATITVVAVMLAVAGYGLFTSLAGRSLLREDLVPED